MEIGHRPVPGHLLGLTSEIVAVLIELGKPYCYLPCHAMRELEVDAGDAHWMVFDHLRGLA